MQRSRSLGGISDRIEITSVPNLKFLSTCGVDVESAAAEALTIHQNFPSIFIDRVTLRVIQRVCPNQRVEMCRYGWWDRGGCRVGLG